MIFKIVDLLFANQKYLFNKQQNKNFKMVHQNYAQINDTDAESTKLYNPTKCVHEEICVS